MKKSYLQIGGLLSACMLFGISLKTHAQSVGNFNTPELVVNQVGYYPKAKKIAMLYVEEGMELHKLPAKTGDTEIRYSYCVYKDSPGNRLWCSPSYTPRQLHNLGGGYGQPNPNDTRDIYGFDFTAFQTEGKSYQIGIFRQYQVATPNNTSLLYKSSQTFSIGLDHVQKQYTEMAKDAFQYFYFHRLGSEIQAKYLDNTAHARPALHGTAVPCYLNWCGDGKTEPKIGGGRAWADAGDFGIYPVNHAIAAWQMLNLVEFPTQSYIVNTDANDTTDRYLTSDGRRYHLIEEAESGSQFMKNMLPPGGKLAPHKIHNNGWGAGFNAWDLSLEMECSGRVNERPGLTCIELSGTETSKNDQGAGYMKRNASLPSTAATYAVCRTASHLARVIAKTTNASAAKGWLDKALDAANRAQKATVVYWPSSYAHMSNSIADGAGPYADNDITDDQYACFAELYLTLLQIKGTDDSSTKSYRTKVIEHKHFAQFDETFDWRSVRTPANLSLLAVSNNLPGEKKKLLKEELGKKAYYIQRGVYPPQYDTAHSDTVPAGSWRTSGPFDLHPVGNGVNSSWYWGSNQAALNAAVILTYADKWATNKADYDYANSALQIMAYVLGANPMRISYVTGYGKYAETDTHDRWAWHQYRTKQIPYPKGWLSGGPLGGAESAASCYAGSETLLNRNNIDGLKRSWETGTRFWSRSRGYTDPADDLNNLTTDELYNVAGYGYSVANEISVKALNNQPLSIATPVDWHLSRGDMNYAAKDTAPDAWCSKENTINFNSSLLWMATVSSKYLRWQVD